MAMDFPNSPSVGQVFTVDGKQWIWSGTSWNARAANTSFIPHGGTHAVGQSDAITIAQSQVTNLTTDIAGKATLSSPAFTGTPSAPTAAAGTNTTQIATTAFVTTANNLKANVASPTFTGTPAAPTAASGTNTTQIATTAFVTTAVGQGSSGSSSDSFSPFLLGGM